MELSTKKVFIFDKDDTITNTKSILEPEMAHLLANLTKDAYVGIISGSSKQVLFDQVVDQMPDHTNLANFFIIPAGGSALYRYVDQGWEEIYDQGFTEVEFSQVKSLLDNVEQLLDLSDRPKVYDDQVENRGGQISWSAMGQSSSKVPREEKKAWDPDWRKRKILVGWLNPKLAAIPAVARIGGSTSVDITKPGINKKYGVEQLLENLDIDVSDAVYVGDALEPGGNDSIVKELVGLDTLAVADHHETLKILQNLNLKNSDT